MYFITSFDIPDEMKQGFLVDGNLLTNQMTIGRNVTDNSGTFITGISTHGTFEGRIIVLQPVDNNVLTGAAETRFQVTVA